MGDAIGANTCEKVHGWPPDITRPAQPLHNRVGVEHTPARLAKRKLIRARHTPFEFGPEAPDTVSSPQPCWPHRLRAGTVRLGVDAGSRASSWPPQRPQKFSVSTWNHSQRSALGASRLLSAPTWASPLKARPVRVFLWVLLLLIRVGVQRGETLQEADLRFLGSLKLIQRALLGPCNFGRLAQGPDRASDLPKLALQDLSPMPSPAPSS